MELINILTVIAIIAGSIAAIQIQQYIEKKKSNRNSKIGIFKTLMATRGTTLSVAHVEALNRIELEFSDNHKYKDVISTWNEYFNNLCDTSNRDNDLNLWVNNNKELLANLLLEMGSSLNYNFDKALIKRNIYSPQGHVEVEIEQNLIRKGIIDILDGSSPLQINNVLDEKTLQTQTELQEILIDYYKNDKPFNVKVVD